MITPLPLEFKKMLDNLLGPEAEQLIQALDQQPVTSVRLNVRKPVAKFNNATPVPWCPSGLYLPARPEFILDPLLHAGAYYVQDASSMIHEEVVSRILSELKSQNGKVNNLQVLDLCAAPGGKTTAMINALPDGSFVTANEYTQKRVGALKENLDRWGYPLITITNKDSSFFALQGEQFDIIAVDAPCSGEGMMRKAEIARKQWSHDLISQCASLQKEIIINAEKALKPGGYLIYSTCTFNRMENEENAEFISKELNLESVDLKFPAEWNISSGIDTGLNVYRFMPHKTKGEGLFLAVFKKPGAWEPSKTSSRRYNPELKREGTTTYPKIEVEKEKALSYLRGESIVLPPETPKGMVTITYMGLPLGEAKNIGTRANNHYPKQRRILKR